MATPSRAGPRAKTPGGSSNGNGNAPGVFARHGAEFPLGQRRVRIRLLKLGQLLDQHQGLMSISYSLEWDTPGQGIVEGVLSNGDITGLTAWLRAWTCDEFDEEWIRDAELEEVIALCDGILEQSGLAWFVRMMGNSKAVARARLTGLGASPPEAAQTNSLSPTTSLTGLPESA